MWVKNVFTYEHMLASVLGLTTYASSDYLGTRLVMLYVVHVLISIEIFDLCIAFKFVHMLQQVKRGVG